MDEAGVIAEERIKPETVVDKAVNFICPEPSLVGKTIDKLKEEVAAAPQFAVRLWAVYRLADYALGLKTSWDKDYPVNDGMMHRLNDLLRLPLARKPVYDQLGSERYDLGWNPRMTGEMDYLFESSGKRLAEFRARMVEAAEKRFEQRGMVQRDLERISRGVNELGLDGVSAGDFVFAYDYLKFKRDQSENPDLKDAMKPQPLGMDDGRRVQMEMVVDKLVDSQRKT